MPSVGCARYVGRTNNTAAASTAVCADFLVVHVFCHAPTTPHLSQATGHSLFNTKKKTNYMYGGTSTPIHTSSRSPIISILLVLYFVPRNIKGCYEVGNPDDEDLRGQEAYEVLVLVPVQLNPKWKCLVLVTLKGL